MSQEQCVAVVIIHGVGETAPGEAMDAIIDNIPASGDYAGNPERHSTVERLRIDYLREKFEVRTRIVHREHTKQILKFYDLHWADISRAAPDRLSGFLATLRAFLECDKLIGGLLPTWGRKPVGLISRLLRKLLLAASALVSGPIVVLTVLMMVLGVAQLYGGFITRGIGTYFGTDVPTLLAGIVVMLLAAATAHCALGWLENTAHRQYDALLQLFAYGALFVALLYVGLAIVPDAALKAARYVPPRHCLGADAIYYLIRTIWFAWCCFFLASLILTVMLGVTNLVLRPFGLRQYDPRARAAMVALGLTVLQASLWFMIVAIFFIPLLSTWSVAGALETFGSRGFAECSFMGSLTPFVATSLLVVGTILASLATLYFRRSIVARKYRFDSKHWVQVDKKRWVPRMLFGSAIVIIVLLGGLLHVALADWDLAGRGAGSILLKTIEGSVGEKVARTIETGIRYLTSTLHLPTTLLTGTSILAVWLLGTSSAIHMARDLLIHQERDTPDDEPPQLPWDDPNPVEPVEPGARGRRRISETRSPISEGHWDLRLRLHRQVAPTLSNKPGRDRIQARLDSIVDELMTRDKPARIIFAAHSQGSIILYDCLSGANPRSTWMVEARPHVITLGSPLQHLYGHYFKEYAELESHLTRLIAELRVASWTNFFRVHDYIGREIIDEGKLVDNRALERGGHTGYWTDKIVCEAIMEKANACAA